MTVNSEIQPGPPRIRLRSPADLVAVTPYLLGFHPTDSLVVVAFRSHQLAFAARSDLPGTDPPARLAHQVVETVARQDADAIAAVGYGPAAGVDPLLSAVRTAAQRGGLRVMDLLVVDGGRWWSRECGDPGCCPPEGTPIDLAASEVPARCAVAGLTAAPSRQDLARRVAPVDGAARTAMTRATDRADRRLAAMLAALPEGDRPEAALAAGTGAVDNAIARYGDGGTLDDDELAWLSLLLDLIPVRDVAWRAITTGQPHLQLWTDVTRRADPALVPAPASLLAFAAWRSGDGALAGLAVERALDEDPDYSMAQLLLEVLRHGVPPSTLDTWPLPDAAPPSMRDAA